MIEDLASILRVAGLDPTAQEIADALWLAARMAPAPPPRALESSDAADSAPQQPPTRPIERKVPDDPVPVPSGSRASRERRAGMYLEGGGAAARVAGAGVRSPGATALPGALALGRALRPLKRRVGSRTRVEIDEAATADRIAQRLHPALVLRPARARWLDLALVIEGAASMALWRQTVQELRALLAHHGAFRDVRVYQLATDEGPEVRLFAGAPGSPRRAASPRELFDPSGRRLILGVSDCVSPAWDDGRVGQLVGAWGRHGPVAVIQVLPERLWRRSALGAVEVVRLGALEAGAANTRLAVERLTWDLMQDDAPSDTIAVPVMDLGALSVSAWAKMLARGGDARAAGVMLPTAVARREDATPDDEGAESEALTPEARVRRFQSMASPEARKLATLFAAAPLSLPVMRLIRETMLPEATLGHLAEVFLGGLLREIVEGEDAVDPEYVRYDFFEGVRDLLLDAATAGEATGVLARVSEYIRGHLGSSLDFRAWLADPSLVAGEAPIAAADRPFAKIGAAVLRRLGGAYAKLADRLAPIVDDDWAMDVSTYALTPPKPDTEDDALLARLDVYARDYEKLRQQPRSDQRTVEMDHLVGVISTEIRLERRMTGALIDRFERGGDGDRVVVLAVLLRNPDPLCFALVRLCIEDNRSLFEQYTALRVVSEMLPLLDRERLEELRSVLLHQLSGADGTGITRDDPSTWNLARMLLNMLQELPEASALDASASRRTPNSRGEVFDAPAIMDGGLLGDLCVAYDSGDLILFVGAGVSAAAGLPTWLQLAELLLERVRGASKDAVSLEEIEQLIRSGRYIDALFAAKHALGEEVFNREVERAFAHRQGGELPSVLRAIAALRPKLRAVLTTNIDGVIERAFEDDWEDFEEPTSDLASRRHYIWKLHGTLGKPRSWVFSRDPYDTVMFGRTLLQDDFKALYMTHPILFVGFGLADDNLDVMLGKVRALSEGQPPTHYALMPEGNVDPARRRRLEAAGVHLLLYENADGTHAEVEQVLRGLAHEGPPTLKEVPVTSNTGTTRSDLGRREEALAATQEAVALRRILAQSNPDAVLPALATSLKSLSTRLSDLGRREEALAARQEVASLYRMLAQGNPDAFLPDLAASLSDLGKMLNTLGRGDEALAIAREALEALWPLFERFPQAFARKMNMILGNLASLHESLDRPLSPALQDRIATFQRLTAS